MALVDKRKRTLRYTKGSWQETSGPIIDGHEVWRSFNPASTPVPSDVSLPAKRPIGATAWPSYPTPSVIVDFDNPRTGKHEHYELIDPNKIQENGCVEYRGYPRNGSGSHTWEQVPIPALGARARGNVSVDPNKFIWASDLIAASPGTNWLIDGGYNLRTIMGAASNVAKTRGVWGILVNDLEDRPSYIPDWQQGWHTGVHCSSDYNQMCGYVTTGPKVRLTIAPSARPTDVVVSGTTTQRGMMHDSNPMGSNYASLIYFSNVPAPNRVWVGNALVVHPGPNFKDNDGTELFWNGIKIDNNEGPIMERVTVYGGSCGYMDYNPGETFFFGVVNTNYSHVRDCLFDGRDLSGVRRMTSPIGHNGQRGTPVVPMVGASVERCTVRYGRHGMITFWLCQDVHTSFVNVYSTAVGGGGGKNGVGRNYEEVRGPIRSFYDSTVTLGKYSTDTTNPDYTQNSSFWCGFSGTAYFGNDVADDAVIWQPKWLTKDYQGFDSYGKLALTMNLGYTATSGDKAKTVTHPLVYFDGATIPTYSNLDVQRFLLDGTRIYPSVPAGQLAVKISQ